MLQKLHGQGMAKMYLTFIIAALKAEKFQKPKCGLFFKHPVPSNNLLNWKSFVKSTIISLVVK